MPNLPKIAQLIDPSSIWVGPITQLLNHTLGDGAFCDSDLLQNIPDKDSLCLYALVNATLAGFARFEVLSVIEGYRIFEDTLPEQLMGKKVGSLSLITVAESFRGQGIATRLTEKGLQWLRDQKCDATLGVSWVSGISQNSEPLFKHFGFQRVAEASHFYQSFSQDHSYKCPGCHCFPCECSAILYIRK